MIENRIKFWTFFWDLGIIILIPIIMLIIALIPGINNTMIPVVPGVVFVAMGLNCIISTILKLPHIYCISQKQRRQVVTYYPYHMDWKNNFNKKDMILSGIIFLIIGLITIIVFLAILIYDK